MQRFALFVLAAVALLVLAQPSSAQTTVYFTYYTNASVFNQVCGTGSLSCSLVTGTTANYSCSSVTSGTHYYYPSATAPTYTNAFASTIPATCEGYNASNTLPITPAGLNLQYGSTCINLYLSGGQVRVSPDARTGPVNFTYSTPQSQVASCPTAPVSASSTGSATVGFVYTITGTTGFAQGVTVCGTGNLQCTSYGSNEYNCPTLLNGVQYVYNASTALSTPTTTSYTLGGEVECNSFGDGWLPLNYEGIAFGLSASSRGCTSLYQTTSTAGVVTTSISYNVISGTNTFSYQGSAINNPAQACAAYIPNLYTSSSTGTNFVFPSSSGNQQNSAHSTASTPLALLLLVLLALLCLA